MRPSQPQTRRIESSNKRSFGKASSAAGRSSSCEQILKVALSCCNELIRATAYRMIKLPRAFGAINHIVLPNRVIWYDSSGTDLAS